MIRVAIASPALMLGLALGVAWAPAASAAAPMASSPAAPVASQAQPVVEVYVGGGYYGPRGYPRYRYYPWHRPWYSYGAPAYYYEPPPVMVVTQPPPQPVWTGTDVIWMFPGGAPQ